MVKIRQDNNANYKAVFFNGKTIRMQLNNKFPITTPTYPEIEDVAINSKCYANCSYCYTSATKDGTNFNNIITKAIDVWGSLKESDRPFQIAVGGAGESTIHPDWVEFMKCVKDMGIMPNYTTNGMHLSDKILKATNDHCGGVALSWHPHLNKVFDKSMEKLSPLKTSLNTHVIIGDRKSLDDLKFLYEKWGSEIDYFVILPYQSVGRGKEMECESIWKETFEWISTVQSNKFAFGALFYNYILNNNINLVMSIYEPEIYSGYRMMDNTYKTLKKSSYDLQPK